MPSCELYNEDTGQLICRQEPVYGTSHWTPENPYDEEGYVLIPPCLWGSEEEGLVPGPYLSYGTNMLSIKKNNNTNGHYGGKLAETSWPFKRLLRLIHSFVLYPPAEMAMWQGRGWQSYPGTE